MLIVFDKRTGEVLDNTGTSSAWPNGPDDPDEIVDPEPLDLSDVEDPEERERLQDAHRDAEQAAAAERSRRAEVLDRVVHANVPDNVPRKHVGYVRVHDDSDLAQQLLTHEHHVDPASGEVVVGDPHPEPEPPGPTPRDEAREHLTAAQAAETDSEKVGHLTAALEVLLS